jgi:hypothetical protein
MENLKEKNFLENQCIDWREILNLIINKYDRRMWTGTV